MVKHFLNNINPRELRVVKNILAFLLVGIVYFFFISITHISIPCIFHTLTGYKCPGCGITTCLVSLLHLDFTGAYQANPLVIWLLPILLVYGGYKAKQYCDYNEHFSKGEICFLVVLLVITISFGVLRNII